MLPQFNYTPNPAQLRNILIDAHTVVNIWPRGQGKTFDIARQTVKVAHGMPLGTSLFVGRTYKKLKRDIIPEISEALSKQGYYEGIHYVKYKAPDKSLEFPRPLKSPGEYENIITFYTGHSIQLISQDRDISARGKSVNYVFADELLEIKQDKFEAEILPANRGNDEYFGHLGYNHGYYLCSSKPIGQTDQWILKYSKHYEESGIDYQLLLRQMTNLEIALIKSNNSKERKEIWEAIQAIALQVKWYTKNGVFYNETRFWNNIKNLGWAYIKQQFNMMLDLRFRVEMLNQTIDKIENGFYPAFRDDWHVYYDSYNYAYIDTQPDIAEEDSLWDSDYDPWKPINIGQDFGVNFNGLTVSQRHGYELRFINEFYVKDGEWMKEVLNKFIKYYKHHLNKTLYYDCDPAGFNRNPNSPPVASDAMEILRKAGWNVIQRSTSSFINPDEKYTIAHKIYSNNPKNPEHNLLYITFNGNRCKNTIISIKLSPVKKVKNGLAKNKASEQSIVIPQEIATHFSDAHDFTVFNEYGAPTYQQNIPPAIFPGR